MTRRNTEMYRQAGDILRRDMGPATFLVNRRRNTIHQLNVIGAAVWDMLADPVQRDELAQSLQLAFPDADGRIIEQDLDGLLDRLLAEELVAAC